MPVFIRGYFNEAHSNCKRIRMQRTRTSSTNASEELEEVVRILESGKSSSVLIIPAKILKLAELNAIKA